MISSIRKVGWRQTAGACVLAIAGSVVGCTQSQADRVQGTWDGAGRRYDAVMAKPREQIDKYIRPSMKQQDPVLADAPMDEADTARGWEAVRYGYPNGAVVAGPTYGLHYEDRPSWLRNDYAYSASQSLLIVAEAVAMPFWMVVEPPLTRLEYHGAWYPPSRTVAPPLPAGN